MDIKKEDILYYKEKNKEKKINNLDASENKVSGVWVLYGYSNQWYALQVGISNNIAAEVSIDVERIGKSYNGKTEKVYYINQFGERIFEYERMNLPIDEVYKDISKKYSNLVFIKACEEKNHEKKRQIEKYIASKLQAVYWRNGRPYGEGNSAPINFAERSPMHPIQLSEDKDLDQRIKDIENYLKS